MTSPLAAHELPAFIGVAEAVRYAPRSRLTITRALRSGDLPGSHAANTSPWVIRRDDLIAWVDAGCPVTHASPDAPASPTGGGVITSCDAPRTGGGSPTPGVAVATSTRNGDADRVAS